VVVCCGVERVHRATHIRAGGGMRPEEAVEALVSCIYSLGQARTWGMAEVEITPEAKRYLIPPTKMGQVREHLKTANSHLWRLRRGNVITGEEHDEVYRAFRKAWASGKAADVHEAAGEVLRVILPQVAGYIRAYYIKYPPSPVLLKLWEEKKGKLEGRGERA